MEMLIIVRSNGSIKFGVMIIHHVSQNVMHFDGSMVLVGYGLLWWWNLEKMVGFGNLAKILFFNKIEGAYHTKLTT